MSLDRLIEKIEKTQNPSVAGLDPKLAYVPEFIKEKCFDKYGETLKGAAKALLEFNKGLIDALYDIVPAVKPQAAYYEMYGPAGVKTLYKTQEYARSKGMYVITDGKRNDIGTTMEAYAAAHLGKVQVGSQTYEPFLGDALTVNGYLGSDGIKPLVATCRDNDKGIFVLVKTSNPSSGELQDKKIDGVTIYETMGHMCEEWGKELPGVYGYSGVGAVVGATYPENGSPVVKVADIHIVQCLLLEEVLPHKQLGYGVADWRACGYTLPTQQTPMQSQSIMNLRRLFDISYDTANFLYVLITFWSINRNS